MKVYSSIFVTLVGVAGVSAATFDADTMAFYPFADKAVGEHLTSVAGEVANAVGDSYSGRGYSTSAYGYCAPGVTSEKPYVCDDLPGNYLFANASATEPLYGPGEWRSLVFPDHAAGYVLQDGELIFQPLITNSTAKVVTVSYKDGYNSTRQQSGSTLVLAGLDRALGEKDEWTMEFFLKHDSAWSGQLLMEMKSYMGFEFYSLSGTWYQQSIYFRTDAAGTSLGGRIWNSSDTSLNLAECGWRHVALVRSGSSLKLYFDYDLKGSTTAFPQRDSSVDPIAKYNSGLTDDLIIGDYRTSFPGNSFYGRIAGLRVTQRALDVTDFLVVRKANDTLTITGDYEVPAEGETYSAVAVSGSARITGGPLQVESALTVSAGTATFANAGVALIDAHATTVTLGAGTTLNMDTILSGEVPSITLQGAGTAYFSQANTFTGNLIVTGGCKFHIANDLALGTTAGYTWLQTGDSYGASELVFDGVDISESIRLTCDNSSTVRLRMSSNTRNVLRGAFTRLAGRPNYFFEAGSYTVLSNACNQYDYISHSGHDTAQVDIYDSLLEGRVSFSAGTYRFYARHANFTSRNYGIMMNSAQTRLVMGLPYVFSPSEEAEAYDGAILRFSQPGTFDLNGYDQRVRSFVMAAAGHIVSEQPATLHVSANRAGCHQVSGSWVDYTPQQLNATVEGAVSLSIEGSLPINIGGENTTTGCLSLVNGAAATFTATGSWRNGPVSVGAGSSLTVMSNLAFGDTTELDIATGGTVTLNTSVSVKRLMVDGEAFTDVGTYGPIGSGAMHELAELQGVGVITIAAQAAGERVWQSTGTDTSLLTAENWVDGLLPDWARAMDTLLFSAAGEWATVDTTASVQGVVLSRPAGGAFTLAAGGGSLQLGTLGIESHDEPGDEVEGRHYTNNAPTTMTCPQTWTFPGRNSEFVQNGSLSALRSTDVLSIKGKGAFHLASANPDFHGTWDFQSDATLSGMVVHVWNDQAFGAADVKVNVAVANTQNRDNICNNLLYFHGDRTIANDITFSGADSRKLKFDAGSRVVFNGRVDFGKTIVRPSYGQGTEVIFAGGMLRGSCWREAPPLDGRVVITNVPCAIGSMTGSSGSYLPSTVDIYTPGNTFEESGYGLELGGHVDVNLHAPYAISRTTVANAAAGNLMPKIDFRYGWGYAPKYDLGGFNQSCSYLDQTLITTPGADTGHAIVTSATPAQLEVYQHPDKTISRLAFEGAAGLTLEGPGTLTLNGTPSHTTGSLILKGGNLVLGTTWTNVTQVVLEAGSLAVTANEVFGKKVTVLKLMTGGGTLDLGGTTQFVQQILLDGVPLAAREYRAGDAALKGLVTGAGTLRAYGDGPGTLLLLR